MTHIQATLWLKKMDSEIRRFCPFEMGSKTGWYRLTGNLTRPQWAKIKKIIEEHDLPCLLHPTCYGFMLVIHENKKATIFSKKRPSMLLAVEDSQFPFLSAKKGFAGQMSTLNRLAPLTHSEKNKSLLKLQGFKALKNLEHYEY
ncbi:MAG: hypothetical protein WCW46_02765 [Candidatus Paceibacterota bacterium]